MSTDAFGWIWAHGMLLYISALILFILSAWNHRQMPVPSSALQAGIVWVMNCVYFLYIFFLLSFWYRFIFEWTIHRTFFQDTIGFFLYVFANSYLAFEFLRFTTGVRLVVNPLRFWSWSLLFIVDNMYAHTLERIVKLLCSYKAFFFTMKIIFSSHPQSNRSLITF